jgi:hypothetical protein
MTTNLRWTVETDSGAVYHLDLARRTLRREGGVGASELRRDGNEVRIVAASTPVLGERWCLVLVGLAPGALTTRLTTPVVSITPG